MVVSHVLGFLLQPARSFGGWFVLVRIQLYTFCSIYSLSRIRHVHIVWADDWRVRSPQGTVRHPRTLSTLREVFTGQQVCRLRTMVRRYLVVSTSGQLYSSKGTATKRPTSTSSVREAKKAKQVVSVSKSHVKFPPKVVDSHEEQGGLHMEPTLARVTLGGSGLALSPVTVPVPRSSSTRSVASKTTGTF